MSIFLHHLSLCFCEREEKNRKEKRTRARHEREKINRREREKKQTNTNLASPRSRSRSPLAPPAKASECRLVFANPFVFFFFFSLLFFTPGLFISLSLSLSLSLYSKLPTLRDASEFLSLRACRVSNARAVCSCCSLILLLPNALCLLRASSGSAKTKK